MKIVIATPLYPPDVGGPSYYAKGLEESFANLGHDARVVRYGYLRHLPIGISHAIYFCKILPRLFGADVIIALDTVSVALPTMLACMLLRKRLIVRTGGDFVWEGYVERAGIVMPLPDFYKQKRMLSLKERAVVMLTRWLVARAYIVFSTEWQRDIWKIPYMLDEKRISIIGNAMPARADSATPSHKNFLWYTRNTAIKNGKFLHDAFEEARKEYPEIILEEGSIEKSELNKRMKSCYAVLLPSVTDISPNYIFDGLQYGKPFICTKYCGQADILSKYGELVDPLNIKEIADAIKVLASGGGYAAATSKSSAYNEHRDYNNIAEDFLSLWRKIQNI